MSAIIILLALLVGSPAGADIFSMHCQNTAAAAADADSNTVVGGTMLNNNAFACWAVTDNDSDDLTSPEFTLTAPSTLICLDSDTTATAIGAARVDVRHCIQGDKPAANPEFQCFSVVDNTCAATPANCLDGTSGSPSQQNACVRVGPGTYYLVLETSPAGPGDPATVLIQSEGDQP